MLLNILSNLSLFGFLISFLKFSINNESEIPLYSFIFSIKLTHLINSCISEILKNTESTSSINSVIALTSSSFLSYKKLIKFSLLKSKFIIVIQLSSVLYSIPHCITCFIKSFISKYLISLERSFFNWII